MYYNTFGGLFLGTMSSLIVLKNVCKYFNMGNNIIKAVDNMSFEINSGEFVVILGPSGSGKTTLLNLLGGMDKITSGEIIVNNKNLGQLNKKEMTLYRRNDVGFVFQFYNLMTNLTALENVELSTELCKNSLNPVEVLTQVGLKDRLDYFPSQLSGGEQQRVSIARAISKNGELLLCDEPTGALDYQTGKSVLKTLFDCSRLHHKTVIVVTHNSALSEMSDKLIRIKNGHVENITINKNPKDIMEIKW